MSTIDMVSENVWAAGRSLCNELMDLDIRAAREGWGNLGARIADAAVEVLAELSSGCGPTDGPTARLRALTALRRAGEGLVRLQQLIRMGERARHISADEAGLWASRTKDIWAMFVALGVVVRSEGGASGAGSRLWT